MSYHKQLQKQKRKQMALEREKQDRIKNDAYSESKSGSWKALLSVALLAGLVIYSFNGMKF